MAPPESQSGRWQVFEKVKGLWVAIADPEPGSQALARVREIKAARSPQECDQRQPHAVPL